MPKDPMHDVPDPAVIEAHMRALKAKLGIKEPKQKPIPGTGNELWPGGPGVDTNDIRIAGRSTEGPDEA